MNPPDGYELAPVGTLTPGRMVIGTASGDIYQHPRIVETITHAPEHSQRTAAYLIRWRHAGTNVYYRDTQVYVKGQRR